MQEPCPARPSGDGPCAYSKAMGQPRPRRCIWCNQLHPGELAEMKAGFPSEGAADRFQAGAATAWLLANTPERWCWTFGFHPFHAACEGRGPGQRRIVLTLLLPEEPNPDNPGWRGNFPRFVEEMTVQDEGASYLALAQRAAARARDHVAGRNQPIPESRYREHMAAEGEAVELLKRARKLGGWAPVRARELQPASMLVRLGLATVEDGEDGITLRLTAMGHMP